MNSIFSKLRDFVSFNDPADYDYEYDELEGEEYQNLYQQENARPESEEAANQRRRNRRERTAPLGGGSPISEVGTVSSGIGSHTSNVIGMPGATNGLSEVLVMEPRSFEEMPQAIQALRERKSVVLNLTMMDPDQAQRAVDFVAGGTYAIDGHQERIGESIFLFTPNCVQVSTQSGVAHEVPYARAPRPAAPTPAWAADAPVSRFAQ